MIEPRRWRSRWATHRASVRRSSLRCAAEPGGLGDDVVVYGDDAILRRGAELLGLDLDVDQLPIVDLGLLTADQHRPGRARRSVRRSRTRVRRGGDPRCTRGHVAGVVTMPMNKEATQLSDPTFVGHTELIAGLCGAERVTMMLTNGQIAVTHVSTHVALQEAIRRVRRERVLDVDPADQRRAGDASSTGRASPSAVSTRTPASTGCSGARTSTTSSRRSPTRSAEGIDASGPHPADTVFFQAVHRDRYDAIVCMYHDQGHAPMKLLAFEDGVNVTLGLPIIRTSVDHGTAFDIAWKGVAFTQSLRHALDYAWKLAGRQRRRRRRGEGSASDEPQEGQPKRSGGQSRPST